MKKETNETITIKSNKAGWNILNRMNGKLVTDIGDFIAKAENKEEAKILLELVCATARHVVECIPEGD